jgi:hypothetical protein
MKARPERWSAWSSDKYLGELAQFPRAGLSGTDQLSHDTLKWNL